MNYHFNVELAAAPQFASSYLGRADSSGSSDGNTYASM
jgi:hypothetical protein